MSTLPPANIDFSQEIVNAQRRIEDLQLQAQQPQTSHGALLAQAIQEATFCVEEMMVMMEEMTQQIAQISNQGQIYAELFDSAPVGYIVTDSLHLIRTANQAAAHLLNTPQSELIDRALILFVPYEEREEVRERLDQIGPGQLSHHWYIWLCPQAQEPIPVEVSVMGVLDSHDQIEQVRWILRDLSQPSRTQLPEQALQVERELKQMRSRFVQTISHEYRTPLSVLKTAVDLLERIHGEADVQPERSQRLFGMARNSVQTLIQMMDDTLVFSSMDVGKLKFQTQEIPLGAFCRQLVEEYQLTWGDRRSIPLIYEAQDEVIWGDERLLRQILTNLITNALKYSPSTSPVRVAITQTSEILTIEVTDQGIGIPLEEQNRIFEPFHRCENIGQAPGTGLGLAILKRAITLWEGCISLTSEIDRGSTFTVTLPLKRL